MSKHHLHQQKKRATPGSPPGVLIPDPHAHESVLNIIIYDTSHVEEYNDCTIDDVQEKLKSNAIIWVNVDGLGDLDLVEKLGDMFGLHQLALEDVVNVHQRPKFEQFEDHIFLATRMISMGTALETSQITMFLFKKRLLTFQEHHTNLLQPIKKRLLLEKGRFRSSNADYLAYTLLDSIIDHYFPVVENIGDTLEDCEKTVIMDPDPAIINRLHTLKRELLLLRRLVWPQREMINELIRIESPLIQDNTQVYLRDCHDHVFQLMDIIETYREMTSGILDIYLSSLSNRLNEVMKVLTIIATIFIPLSFVASLYGMNFNTMTSPWNMPELNTRFGYPFVLLIMLITAAGLIYFFKRKGWIGKRK